MFIYCTLLISVFLIFSGGLPCRADMHGMVDFTLEEQEFLKRHPELRLGVGVAFPPFQYVETSDGDPVFKGMVSDYLALIEKRLKVKMKPIFGIDFTSALEMGRKKEIDIFPCIAETPERKTFLRFTEPYLSYPLVIAVRDNGPFISHIEDLHNKRLAIIPNLANWSKLKNQYPHLQVEVIPEKDIQAKFEAVALGKADACIANLAVLSYTSKKLGLSNLRVAAPTPWGENKLAMGVRDDWPVLVTILQKALDSITWQERNEISERWIALKYQQVTDHSMIWKTALTVGGAAGLIILVIFAWNRRLKQEIHERIKAEETLARSEEKYRNLIDSTDTAFVIMDRNGKVLDANNRYIDLTGRTEPGQIIGHDAAEWLPGNRRKSHESMLEECSLSKVIRDLQMEFILPDGSLRPVEINGTCHSNGETLEIHALCRDISGRKRAEEIIIHTEKMMSAGGIAAGIAHEVNNPLTAVLGNAQNLVRRIQPGLPANEKAAAKAGVTVEAVRKYMQLRGIAEMLESIRESAIKAAKVISKLLIFSQGNTEGYSENDLVGIIDEALELAEADYDLQRKYDFRDIVVTRNYDPRLSLVRCNYLEIQQVILNLLRNSAQAMAGRFLGDQKPALTIRAQLEGDTAVISVQDNGPGMTPEVRRRAFDPFFTTAAPNGAAGLGLSAAYFIVVRNHQGHIDAQSAPGEGTTITIRLPVEGPSMTAESEKASFFTQDFFDNK